MSHFVRHGFYHLAGNRPTCTSTKRKRVSTGGNAQPHWQTGESRDQLMDEEEIVQQDDYGKTREWSPPPAEELRPKSIRDLGFTGMWADRDDIPDGLSYVNRLRDNPRG